MEWDVPFQNVVQVKSFLKMEPAKLVNHSLDLSKWASSVAATNVPQTKSSQKMDFVFRTNVLKDLLKKEKEQISNAIDALRSKFQTILRHNVNVQNVTNSNSWDLMEFASTVNLSREFLMTELSVKRRNVLPRK